MSDTPILDKAKAEYESAYNEWARTTRLTDAMKRDDTKRKYDLVKAAFDEGVEHGLSIADDERQWELGG